MSSPTTAVLCRTLGGPELLEVVELPGPAAPGPGEVVVAVEHVGLNFHDLLVLSGEHVVRPEPPFSPGSEYAGTVTAVGPGVHTVAIGDRVAGNEEFGCARSALTVSADRITPLPDAVSTRDAVAILVAYGTAFHALVQRAAVRPGETVLVLGSSGGVGSAAVDLADLVGAHVVAAASDPDRAALALDRGARSAFGYGGDADLRAAVREHTSGAGADVVVDPVGGTVAGAALRSVAWGGRYLVVGFAGGEIPSVRLNIPLVKGSSVVGVFFGEFVRRRRALHERNMATVFGWAAAGRLRPLVHDVLPLTDAARAYRLLADRAAVGKVVLSVAG